MIRDNEYYQETEARSTEAEHRSRDQFWGNESSSKVLSGEEIRRKLRILFHRVSL